MTFLYRRYRIRTSNGRAPLLTYRPVVHVRLIGPAGDLRLFALVDTGADQTLFPRWAADQIGVNVNDTDSLDIVGIGGQRIPAPSGEIEIELADQTETFHWATVVRFVSLPDPQTQLAILGHVGCLNFFTATFDGQNRSIDLVPNDAFPGT